MTQRLFTDDTIPETGIYSVFHSAHQLVGSVKLHCGALFPRCSQCGDQVGFELMLAIKVYQPMEMHIFELPLLEDEPPGQWEPES